MGTTRIAAFALSLVLVFTAAPLIGIADQASAEACTLEDDGDRPFTIRAPPGVPYDEVDDAAGPVLAYADCQLDRCTVEYRTVETPDRAPAELAIGDLQVPSDAYCTLTQAQQYCPLLDSNPSIDVSEIDDPPYEFSRPIVDVNEDFLECMAPACADLPQGADQCIDGLCLDRINPKTGEGLEECLTVTQG